MVKKKIRNTEITSIAAILVTLSSLLAAVCWITSGKAGGEASDLKTAALGVTMIRLEAETEASIARTEQQTYLTQAAMYWAYAEMATDEENRAILENVGNSCYYQSILRGQAAENSENRARGYENASGEYIDSAKAFGIDADYRSTGALIFNVSTTMASFGILLKREEIFYIYVPIFAIGLFYFMMSLL